MEKLSQLYHCSVGAQTARRFRAAEKANASVASFPATKIAACSAFGFTKAEQPMHSWGDIGFSWRRSRDLVAPSRCRARQVRHQGLARLLIGCKQLRILKRRDRREFAFGKACKRSVDHVFRRHDDLAGEVFDGRAGDAPEFGGRRARQHDLDADVLIGKLMLQRLAESEHEGFRSAINAVQNLGRDRHDGGDIDDGATAAGDETGHDGIGQPHHRGHVDIDHFLHLVGVGLEQRRRTAEAGIVDEHGDAPVFLQHLFDFGEIVFAAKVGGQRLDGAAGLIGQPACQRLQPLAIAGDENEIVALLCQPMRIDRTNARRCARYQRRTLMFLCHDRVSVFARRPGALRLRRVLYPLADVMNVKYTTF
ncbi:hypothetical protein RHSP_08955 [Rhizobium freirei PRF 81]|uniref:Uncharacterized protein n=1 Tax=Rhizobium freirei PRF 81 TaxID=363754 RepID=N6V663_9HYPH|nr:hypothetical protein RHSP_08955 [Rhizobium freirei PRF 81]